MNLICFRSAYCLTTFAGLRGLPTFCPSLAYISGWKSIFAEPALIETRNEPESVHGVEKDLL